MKISTALPRNKAFLMSAILLVPMLLAGCDEGGNQGLEASAAEIFEPGNLSTGHEYGVTFSPDGQYIYFTRGNGIYWAQKEGDGWSSPQIAEFAKGGWITEHVPEGLEVEYFNWDPVISPDGSKLFIMSHGLVNGRIIDGEDGKTDLWVLEREGDGYAGSVWGTPKNMGPAINSPDHSDGAIGVAADGTAYFFSHSRSDGLGSGDIYYAPFVDGQYLQAENIGTSLNTEFFNGHTYPDPQGRFLLYISNDFPSGYGSCDIYVSWRDGDEWGQPQNLGPNVNTGLCEITPSLTPDGKTLFFGRIEDWDTDTRNIYAIELKETYFSKK